MGTVLTALVANYLNLDPEDVDPRVLPALQDSVRVPRWACGRSPFGRVVPAGVDSAGRPTRARMVIFRMPLEERAQNPGERAVLVGTVLTALVATYLNEI